MTHGRFHASNKTAFSGLLGHLEELGVLEGEDLAGLEADHLEGLATALRPAQKVVISSIACACTFFIVCVDYVFPLLI